MIMVLDPLWSVFRDGERVTIAAFFSQESAERVLTEWRAREAAGGRPDVTTEGLYVAQIDQP